MKYTLCLLFILTTCVIRAQTPSVRWEGGFSAKHQWNKNWSLKTTILARETFNSYTSEKVEPYTDRYEVKPFINYSFGKQHKISLGYMFRQNNPFREGLPIEHRITQQYNYSGHNIEHKIRLEERILKKDNKIRLRYELSFEKEVGRDKRTVLIFADELLLEFKNGKKTLENRIDFGFGRKFENGRKLKFLLSNRNENIFGHPKLYVLQLVTVYAFNI